MTAFVQLPGLPHLDPIFEAVAALNPHDGAVRALAIDPRRSMALMAPAGSGKTTTLQLRLLACLTTVERPEEVLAITFTNMAAAEIVERVMGALSQAVTGVVPTEAHEIPQYHLARLVLERDQQLGWNLLLNPSRLRIMTFDSFCAFLASKTPIMSGLGGGKTTDDAALIYRLAILETLQSVNDNDLPEALADALKAVLSFAKNRFETLVPMFANLLAKRDQWASRIMNLDIGVMQEVVSDMVLQAAEQALSVIRGTEVESCMACTTAASGVFSDFPWAVSRPVLSTDPACLEYLRDFAGYMLTKEGNVRSKVDSRNGFPAKHELTKEMNGLLASIKGSGRADELSEALCVLASLPDLQYPEAAAEMCQHFTIILRYLLANLTLTFEATNSLDFPEIAQRAIQSLGTEESVGDALLDEDRIAHILVDEVQDTNQAQFDLLLLLTAHWENTDGRSIFFCGDLLQAIYYFRGGDVTLFNNMVESRSFGAKELEVLYLVVNFRSSPGVVNWNNETYAKIFANSPFKFVPSVPFRKGEGGFHVRPVSTGPIGEAQEVARIIKDVQATDPTKSIAILVRGRSHLKYILPELKAVGVEVTGQDIDPISESAPVTEVLALTRALWHAGDRTSWLTLCRASFVGLSWKDCLTVARGGKVIHESLKSEAVQEKLSPEGLIRVERLLSVLRGVDRSSRGAELAWAVKSTWMALGGPATVNAGEMDDVETIFKLLAKHTETGDLTDPQAFFRDIDSAYASPKPGSVNAMTLHKSKGLEFDIVIIPGLNKIGSRDEAPLFYWRQVAGTFTIVPNLGHLDNTTPESRLFRFVGKMVRQDLIEERGRLAYVGTTRAKQDCYLVASVGRLLDDEDEEDADEGGYISSTIKPASGSLLECLWPSVGYIVSQVESGIPISAPVTTGVPSKARLDAHFSVQLPKGAFIPAASNDQMPTETELNDELREEEGSDYRAKTVGIVFHWVVELIGKEGVEKWSEERVKSKAQAIASRLRREGYPAAEVPSAVARVISLVVKTIQSKRGQWILKKRPGSGQEVQVSAYMGGRWVHRYLDLSFVEDDTYWICDYKSPECPEGMDQEVYLQREAARYAPKMQQYERAVRDAGINLKIRKVLFYPAFDGFIEVAA